MFNLRYHFAHNSMRLKFSKHFKNKFIIQIINSSEYIGLTIEELAK